LVIVGHQICLPRKFLQIIKWKMKRDGEEEEEEEEEEW
jgi:hypothetical protein